MANTDTELKKLNKTVDDAVNILKIYVGNSAQVKNMNEKERQAIDKWFDVVTEEEQQQKKQRAFTERLRDENGKFIKKRDDQAKKFLGMAGMIKGMFKTMTVGVVSGIGKMAVGIKNHFMNFFGALKSHFLGLFGEESEWFELLGTIKDSIKGMAVNTFKFFFGRTPKWAGSMIKYLKDIYKLQVKQMKLDWLNAQGGKKKKDGWMGMIAVIILAIGAAIGAALHRWFILITKIPVFTKIANMFKSLESIPFIGRLIKGIKFGFKWLGWPLTLILSVIDFIKGFKETEGSMWDKIKGGLWEAFSGFIEMPVRFLSWIAETILGWFGIEVTGIADTIMENWKKVFDYLLDFNPFAPIVDFIEGFFGTEGSFMDKIKGGAEGALDGISERLNKWFGPLMDAISPFITGITGAISELWSGFVDWAKDKIPNWMPGKDDALNALAGGGGAIGNMESPIEASSPVAAVSKTETAKIQNDVQASKSMEQAVDAMQEMQRNAKKDATTNTLNSMSQSSQGGEGGGDVKQIPDEIDNNLVSIKNYSGELD